MDEFVCPVRRCVEDRGLGPMLDLFRSLDHDRQQFPSTHAPFDKLPNGRFALGIQVTSRVQAHEPLRSQRAVEQVFGDLTFRSRVGWLFPSEMAVYEIVGL